MTNEVDKNEVKKVTKTAPKKTTVNVKKKVTATKKKVINDKDLPKLDEEKDIETSSKVENEKVGEVDSTEKKELGEYLPVNFYPRYTKNGMIGMGGCVIIPNRICTFIEQNQDNWYMKMDELPFKTEIGFLHALLYYIIEDGYVNIHEIGSNSYYKLTISEEGSGESEENSRK